MGSPIRGQDAAEVSEPSTAESSSSDESTSSSDESVAATVPRPAPNH